MSLRVFFVLVFLFPIHYAQAKISINVEKKTKTLSKIAPNINKKALKTALHAYNCASRNGLIKKPVLTIIDYSVPSTQRRLWTFNLDSNHLLFHSLVAHGRNSGALRAKYFSDKVNSKQSSLGLFLTGDAYSSQHVGLGLRLRGLEHGYNIHALNRGVVVHGSAYVSKLFAKRHGMLGRSSGCAVVPTKVVGSLINTIKNGSALFTYYPDRDYLKNSKFLHC